MRRRAVVAGVVLAATLAGCGGSGAAKDPLAWKGKVTAFTPPDLPTDRVVVSEVRNASSKPLRLDTRTMLVRAAGGKPLDASVRFVATGFAHGLYGAFQQPSELPPIELRRLGIAITLPPGETAPVTVAWRLAKGAKEPAVLDYGRGRKLKLPVAG